MRNLIPQIINANFEINKFYGKLECFVLYLDITGFTQMTEKLMNLGKEGAETLSNIMNTLFNPIIDIVYQYDGVITSFAGDGFTSLFTKNTCNLEVLSCINDINESFENIILTESLLSGFPLFLKSGLSFGTVNWRIIGEGNQKTYYFNGDAIDNGIKAGSLSNHNGIVLHQSFYQNLNLSISVKQLHSNFFQIDNKNNYIKRPEKLIPYLSQSCLKDFFPQTILKSKIKGEFREVISIFVSILENKSVLKTDKIIVDIINSTKQYGGYFNKIDYGDKGLLLVIFFGAPFSYENDLIRAIDFVLALRSQFKKKIKIGINEGLVYAGFIGSKKRAEYTCLGEVVNQASALMQLAENAEIVINNSLNKKIQIRYKTEEIGFKKLKGKNNPQKLFKIKKQNSNHSFQKPLNPLLGFEKELDLLNIASLPLKSKKYAGVFSIYGDAGMGKSRLINEFVFKKSKDSQIISLQTDNILSKSMNPFIQFFKSFFHINNSYSLEKKRSTFNEYFDQFIVKLNCLADQGIEQIIKELNRTKSFFAGLLNINISDSLFEQLEPKSRYDNTLIAIKEFMKGLSLIKPLILVIEDTHWLDSVSENILTNLMLHIEDFPIMLVFSSRYEDNGEKKPLRFNNKIISHSIELKRLSDTIAKKLVTNLLGDPTENMLINRILQLTDNNPFYIEQYCYYLKENRLVEFKNHQYQLMKFDHKLPVDLVSIMIARIDRLTNDLKEIVQIASVLGREIEIETLRKMIELYDKLLIKDNDLDVIFQEIENQQIWYLLSSIKYIFKHSLLQETVYDMQLRERLKKLHLHAAISIENLYPDSPEKFPELAYHYDKAQKNDKAIEYYQKAANMHYNRYQNEKALFCYNRSIELGIDFIQNQETYIKKANILNTLGKWDEEELFLKHYIDILKQTDNIEQLAEFLNALGIVYRSRDLYDQAFNCFKEALKIAEKINNDNQINLVYGNLGIIHLNLFQYDQAMNYFEKKIALSKKLKDINNIINTIGNIGVIYWNQGNYLKAMECYQSQKTYCESLNNKSSLSQALGNMGIVYLNTGEFDKGKDCLIEKMKICEEIGDKRGLADSVGNLGTAYWNLGDLEKALINYNYWLDTSNELGDKTGSAYATGNIGLIYFTKGDFEKAKINLEYWKQSSLASEDKNGLSSACGNLGLLYWELGDYEKSMDNLEMDKKICEDIGDNAGLSIAIGNIGNMHLEKGEFDKAIECFEFRKKISLETGDKIGLSLALCYLANSYKHLEKYSVSEKLYLKAIKLGKAHGQKYYLCDFFHNLTNLYIITNNTKKAEFYNKKTIKLANDLQDKNMLFYTKVNQFHLLAFKNKAVAETQLLDLLNQHSEHEKIAYLYYELFLIDNNPDYKNKSLELYNALYKKINKQIYLRRIQELKL